MDFYIPHRDRGDTSTSTHASFATTCARLQRALNMVWRLYRPLRYKRKPTLALVANERKMKLRTGFIPRTTGIVSPSPAKRKTLLGFCLNAAEKYLYQQE
jgi:hypothetical protein